MGFVDKLKQFTTGKTSIERRQEAAANAIIRQKANAAALRERHVQAIKFAQERERNIYKQRTERLNRHPGQFNSMSSGFGGGSFIDIISRGQSKGKKNYSQPYRII